MTLKTNFTVAVDALRDAFKSALDDPNFPDNTLAEVWRHYLGMQSILKNLPKEYTYTLNKDADTDGNIHFNLTGLDEYPYVVAAAGSVPIPGSIGEDVITFS